MEIYDTLNYSADYRKDCTIFSLVNSRIVGDPSKVVGYNITRVEGGGLGVYEHSCNRRHAVLRLSQKLRKHLNFLSPFLIFYREFRSRSECFS